MKYFLLGAACFWMPAVIVDASSRSELPLSVYNIPPFLSVAVVYWLLSKRKGRTPTDPSVALCMLCGIWMLGAPIVLLASTFRDGFHNMNRSVVWLLLISFVPILTFVMSGLHFFALIFVTLFLIFTHFRWERSRWVPLYSWHRRTKLNAPS